jgi:hypothetical protein
MLAYILFLMVTWTSRLNPYQDKRNKIAGTLSQVFINSRDTSQGYTTVFIPSIRYALPATSTSTKQLSRRQAVKALTKILMMKILMSHIPMYKVLEFWSILTNKFYNKNNFKNLLNN